MFNDPKILALAFFGGILPSLLWLWFWVKEEEKRVQPKGLLTIVFILGMTAVICVLPIEKFIQTYVSSNTWRLIGWASAEEILKYIAVLVVVYGTNDIDEPVEWPIYLITAALGFAALENALFLIKPLSLSIGATTVSLLTGELRFLGSTLLHTVSSGILGIALGIAFHYKGLRKYWHVAVGLFFAISLHSIFNFFIIRNGGSDFLKVFAFLWVVTVVVMLLFEKVRRMS
ncbi:MAG: PrsW family intramembrane metalloprotease [Patescibacteria group bacterium]|nr:PrsW family intramembrane metalloprotease [Patescibacteria group bacterium]